MKVQLFKQIDRETGLLKKELRSALAQMEAAKGMLKEGHRYLSSLL